MVHKKILHSFRRFFVLLSIPILFIPIVISVLNFTPASAESTSDHIKAWLYYHAIAKCFRNLDKINAPSVNGNSIGGRRKDWDTIVGVYITGKSSGNGKMKCDAAIQAGLPLWGFSSLHDLMTAAGWTIKGSDYTPDGEKGAGPFLAAIRNKTGIKNGSSENFDALQLYDFTHISFVNGCGVDEKPYDSATETEKGMADQGARDEKGKYFKYPKLNEKDGTTVITIGKTNNNDSWPTDATGAGDDEYNLVHCESYNPQYLTERANAAAAPIRAKAKTDWIESLKKSLCKDGESSCEENVKTCVDTAYSQVGQLEAHEGALSTENKEKQLKESFVSCYAGKSGKSKEEITSLIEGTSPSSKQSPDITSGSGGEGTESEEGEPECKIDGVGWLVCPIIEFLGNIADDAQEQLEKYLKISSSILTERDPGSVYDYWSMVRNYANIAFVIVFLVIVYSQITGTGIDNYGIKRMLPRLVVGVVMVNISFYICALMVDISNLLGASAYEFITNLGGKGSEEVGDWTSKGNLLTTIGAAAIVVASGFFFLSATLGGLVFVVLLAVTTVFLLGVRQAMVIFLIILSPLAFVAMLLPNTEGLYKKWWKTLQTMLYMYPVIGLIYGASRLAARILNEQQDKPVSMQVVSAILMFAPLLIVPNIIKSMLAIGGIAGMVGAANNFLNKHVGGKAREFGQRLKDNNSIVQAYRTGKEQRAKNRATRRAMRMHKGISGVVGRVRGGKTWKQRAENSAIAAEDKEIQERVDDAAAKQARLTHQERMDIAKTGMVKDKKGRNVKASDEEREAAVAYAMKAGDVYERRDTLEGLYGSDSTRVRRVAVAGARERGDTELYGNGVLSQIENGSKESDAKNKQTMGTYSQQMSAQLVERMQTGGISNEKMHQDYKTATMLSNAAVGQHTNASGQADGTLDTGTDKHGNQRANSVSQARRQEMKDRAIEWQKTEDGQGKADNIRKRWEDLSTK